jgi:hypothetical protein
MLENFIYENHLGQRFVGLENGVYLNENELRDYTWEYDVINNRISRFYRSVSSRKLPLVICCSTTQEANRVRNRLLELAEADIDAMLPGKIITGEYYTTGFITESKKSDYRIDGRFCMTNLVLTSQDPAWSRETVHVFGSSDEGAAASRSGFDFPFDYDYDYSVSTASRQVVNDTVKSSKFKLKIYGEATDPAVMINGHAYKVNGMIKAGESLLIDSLNKTITLTTASGSKVNWFNNRDRHDYIFEPIPPGVNNVIYNGSFKFDLTIIEERSEPRWI